MENLNNFKRKKQLRIWDGNRDNALKAEGFVIMEKKSLNSKLILSL